MDRTCFIWRGQSSSGDFMSTLPLPTQRLGKTACVFVCVCVCVKLQLNSVNIRVLHEKAVTHTHTLTHIHTALTKTAN